MLKMTALKPLSYAGRDLAPGDAFLAPVPLAKALAMGGRALPADHMAKRVLEEKGCARPIEEPTNDIKPRESDADASEDAGADQDRAEAVELVKLALKDGRKDALEDALSLAKLDPADYSTNAERSAALEEWMSA